MSQEAKKRMFKAQQELPRDFFLNYILLPYGEYYEKTRVVLDAQPGDTLRFFNGADMVMEKAILIPCGALCDYLCKMRYGITWDKAFQKWLRYARMEGHSDGIFSRKKCLLVFFNGEDTV